MDTDFLRSRGHFLENGTKNVYPLLIQHFNFHMVPFFHERLWGAIGLDFFQCSFFHQTTAPFGWAFVGDCPAPIMAPVLNFLSAEQSEITCPK